VKLKSILVGLILICFVATGLAIHWLGGIDLEQLQDQLNRAGAWAPLAYIILYVLATIVILPSTALNLMGGALFGPWLGTIWTSIAALIAAAVAFAFTRTVGREAVAKKLAGYWQTMDAEVQRGGFFYMFALRLLPILPYGLVNFAAGLTSVSFKDYMLGTAVGTVPGVLPFVLLGSSGLSAMQTGNLWPLLVSFGLIGLLVAGSTWYRHRRLGLPSSDRDQQG
jgi:uncharacterized membrane protein YdjX (TVP38/TMEM64 family)